MRTHVQSPSEQAMRSTLATLAALAASTSMAATVNDEKAVFDLDHQYQHAVKHHDAATIARIQADDMILVTGRGKVVKGEQIIENARNRTITYEQQDVVDGTRSVRVWGDTAVVTALLWIKGSDATRGAFDYKLWYSDTYVRTAGAWRYAFGQASIALPKES
jgi:uncharacterized protein (TIGR02246 family)